MPARAGAVLHDDRLAVQLAKLVRQHPRLQVRAATRTEWHDQAQCVVGVCGMGDGRHDRAQQCGNEGQATGKAWHSMSPGCAVRVYDGRSVGAGSHAG
jgi:hypothetical protein